MLPLLSACTILVYNLIYTEGYWSESSLYSFGTDRTESTVSNSTSIVACVSVAEILVYLAVTMQWTISFGSIFRLPAIMSQYLDSLVAVRFGVGVREGRDVCIHIAECDVLSLPYRWVLSRVHGHTSCYVGCSELDIPAGAC
jgi:hypothetical protein